jgi:hypothetical protein
MLHPTRSWTSITSLREADSGQKPCYACFELLRHKHVLNDSATSLSPLSQANPLQHWQTETGVVLLIQQHSPSQSRPAQLPWGSSSPRLRVFFSHVHRFLMQTHRNTEKQYQANSTHPANDIQLSSHEY